MKFVVLTLIICASSFHQVSAQSFDKGAINYRLEEVLPFAKDGNASAQVILGAMYMIGQDVPKDVAEGVKWYELAAMQGNDTAQYMLGISHLTGLGVLKDDIKAHVWFNISAANSNGADNSSAAIRDKLEAHMSRADLSKARAMARKCMSSGYSKCGY